MTNEDWGRTIERRLASLETRNAVDEVHRINVETRLSAIEDTLKWLVRLVMGAIIMGALAYVLRGGLSLGG
ncbi:pseudouridine synthase [Loktanella sp. IMCC34160]|uniref:hemolysin XhlA family protein n=1 Tax=Rhodobacterales TaxID=204455 RepID=UPI00101C8027|nr:hemolysin XhlA family protein [Loktanella sp. IMCC34160]RYG92071.1 pseudouridine synthase [Loktanella sp. IMCC34160]